MEHKIIPVNIVMTYPVRWDQYKVFRDFLQNFYDAAGFQHWKDSFQYKYENKTLSMWIDGIDFSYEWLLHIGASTKTADSLHNAGYFGEGFKIASLCAVRDFAWKVRMASGDWKLDVISTKQRIDNHEIDMLAYDIKDRSYQKTSRLELYPIKTNEFQLFKNVILSFYFYGNPILGEKIWEGKEGAVYTWNNNVYPECLPYTSDYKRKGVVFCSYQMLGSNPFGLAVCLHKYKKEDRERRSLYSFEVVEVFESISYYISSYGAMRVLEKMRRYWNSTPRKHIDIHSWSSVISNFIRKTAASPETSRQFCKKYPNLLCIKPVKTVRDRNRRGQAKAWMAAQDRKYLLVQEGFSRLGYPTLEEVCEQQGGFVVNDLADEQEEMGFEILENVVKLIYDDFFPIEKGMPERKIIQNDDASYHGMAKVYKTAKAVFNSRGIAIRYDIREIYLKRVVFKQGGYYDALATYIHEMCHVFGGDSSNAFSFALTIAMEKLLSNYEVVELFKKKWDSVFAGIN